MVLYNLLSDPPGVQYPPATMHSYDYVIDSILKETPTGPGGPYHRELQASEEGASPLGCSAALLKKLDNL